MTEKKKNNRTTNQNNGYTGSKEIIRSAKNIIVDPDKSTYIDRLMIQKRYCNALSCIKMPEDLQRVRFTLGVTSPNRGEGKTLTAANLAVSLALAYKRKTVLVDMNMGNPSIHKIFGTKLRPGLVESFQNGSIFLSQTKIDQLYILPAGRFEQYEFGLNSIMSIRDILYSLEKEFEIVIVDMSSVFPIDDFPAAFVDKLDGLLVVIDSMKTKYADIDKMFKHIKPDHMLGFIMNNMEE